MEDQIIALIDQKKGDATQSYITRLDEFLKEWNKADPPEKKNEIGEKIKKLSRAFDTFCESCEKAKDGIAFLIERDFDPSYDFFRAKLKDEPHEWD